MKNSKTDHPMKWFSLFCAGLCWFWAAGWLPAQTTTSTLLGTVLDPSGAAVGGVKVTATSAGTGIHREVSTDSNGDYVIPLLQPGKYVVTAEAPGFRAITRSGISIDIAAPVRIDFSMEVGDLKQTINVTGTPPPIQSDSATLGTLVNEKAVQDLPLNGRNFVNLVRLSAGAKDGVPNGLSGGNRNTDRRRPSSVSINGQHEIYNNFLIDGMDDNERFIGTIVDKPSVDALAEFKVMTNAYSAEFGRTAGGVINMVTKSGTNDFHGTAYEFFRNEALDARNFFSASGPKPEYRQNQFGGSVGGPIQKTRTFFFADYERFKNAQGITYVSNVPTAAMRQFDFAGVNPIFDPSSLRANPSAPGGYVRSKFPGDQIPASRIDPVAARMLQFYPLPMTGGLNNNFVYSPNKNQRDDTGDLRVDHQLSPNQSMYARYSINDTYTTVPTPLPFVDGFATSGSDVQSGTTNQRSQNLHLNYVNILRPNLVLEAKAAYTRFSLASLKWNIDKDVSQQIGLPGINVDVDSSGLPVIVIPGFRQLGDTGYGLELIKDNTFQYVANLSYVHGSHSVKTGVNIIRRQISPFESPTPSGQFNFNSNFTNDPTGAVSGSGNALASFLLGLPASTTRSKYLIEPGTRAIETASFMQDDWRVNGRLTLNLGLRWEYFSPFTEVANRISNVDLATGKIIIAGQDGVSRTAGVPKRYDNFGPRFGFAYTIGSKTVVRGGYGLSYYALHLGSISAMRNPPFVSLLQITATPLNPVNQLANGLPPPLPVDPLNPTGNLTTVAMDVKNPFVHQYNLTVQRELTGELVLSASYVGVLGRDQYFNSNINQPLPGPGPVQARRPYVSLFPNVQNIGESHSWGTSDYHALQVTLDRRFSRGLNLQSNYTWAHLIDDYPVIGGGTAGTGPYLQITNDRRLERGNSDIDVRQRWTLMVNYELPFAHQMTGLKGAIAKGWQVNAIAVLQTGLPLSVGNAAARANTGGGDRPDVLRNPNLPSGQQSINRWFDTSAFVPQALYTAGDLGRNTLTGPGVAELDLSLFKSFALSERKSLEFRAESFNVTNTPNFGAPGTSFGAADFGVISNTGNFLPRNIQLALKFLF